MKGSDTDIFNFMVGTSHYIVPIYQRNYSWGQDQCATLYEDMLKLHEKRQANKDLGVNLSHFIGSVVYQFDNDPTSQPGKYLIDGQQRVITMYLFYLALLRAAQQGTAKDQAIAQRLQITLLENLQGSHRFSLSSKADQDAMDKLFAGNEDEYDPDSRLTQNYNYFFKRLKSEKKLTLAEMFGLTEHLSFVQIALDKDDDAQLIFESVNSKGLYLSHGEKVKNFVLMGISPSQAQKSYTKQWYPLELNCKAAQGEDGLDNFIFYYLTIKFSELPEFGKLYDEFKKFYQNCGLDKIKLVEEMNKYSELFRRVKSCSYKLYPTWDTDLSNAERKSMQTAIELELKRLTYFPYERHIPFVMQVMWLHLQHQISAAELLESLKLVEVFYLRRWTYGVPTNTLNRFFATLYAEVNAANADEAGNDFISKLKFVLRSERARVPNDTQFEEAFKNCDFYSNANTSLLCYVLERLENFEHREPLHIMDELEKDKKAYTIEHVMPQNLTPEWCAELGPNAETLHELWKDRIANLTLTAYNSTLSDRPFAEKRDMPNGYKDSILRLTKSIAAHEHWNEEDLKQRAAELSEKALEIWPYPA